MIDKLQVAGELTKTRAPECLPTGTRVTRQNIFVKFHHQVPDLVEEALIESNETIKSDPINGRLMRFAYKLQDIENQEYLRLWHQLCTQAQHAYDILLQLFKLDATLGKRALLGRNVSAEFVGDQIIMVWSCRPIVPQEIYYNRKYDGECYAFVPLKYNGKLFFVAPGSTDVVQDSPKIACEHRTPSIRVEHGTFVTDSGQIHVSEFPYTLEWKASSFDFDFSSPVLFHDKLSGQIASVDIFRSAQYKIRILENQMKRTIDYTSLDSLDPSTVANALIGFGQGIGDVMESYGDMAGEIIVDSGEAVSNVISTAGETAFNVSKGLLSGLWQLIVNIIVLALVALLLVLIMYIIFRYCRARFSRQEGTEPGDDPFHRLASRAYKSIQDCRAKSTEAKRTQKTVHFSPTISRRTTSESSVPDANKTQTLTEDNVTLSRPGSSSSFVAHFQKGTSALKRLTASQEQLDAEMNMLTQKLQKQPAATAETAFCNSLNTLDCKSAMCPIKVNNLETTGFLDIGSGVTLISTGIAKLCNMKIRPTTMNVYAGNVGQMSVIGESTATITIGPRVKTMTVYIQDKEYYDVLLGRDLLFTIGFVGIDPDNRCIVVGDQSIPLGEVRNPCLLEAKVSLNQSSQLPEPNVVNLLVTAPSLPTDDTTFLFEHDDVLPIRNVHDLGHTKDGQRQFKIQVINPQPYPVKLYKGMTLGKLEMCEEAKETQCAKMETCENEQPDSNDDTFTPEKRIEEILSRIDWSGMDIDEQQQQELKNLLSEYADVFALSNRELQ